MNSMKVIMKIDEITTIIKIIKNGKTKMKIMKMIDMPLMMMKAKMLMIIMMFPWIFMWVIIIIEIMTLIMNDDNDHYCENNDSDD